MSQELIRIVDAISRDRNVDKEMLYGDIEAAMVSAARKHFGVPDTEEFTSEIDRITGEIQIFRNGEKIPLETLGRIPAQTAKQVMIQKFREDERASIFDEFIDRVSEITTGTAQRYEGGSLIVQIGRAEGFMPRSEQIPGERHNPGERVRCFILDVRDTGSQVKIVLSRSHPDFIKRLFEVEVPEVSERIIEIKALAREAGHRTKVAVSSIDSKVDAVGACVGVRGSRIKNIVDELAGEKIDIVRWNESSQVLIANALRPAEVVEISLCFELGRATVVVNEDQLSLAIGKRGQNVRLAARLTGWDVDILTPAEFAKGLDILEATLKEIDGVTEQMLDRMVALGFINVFDVEDVGEEALVEQFGDVGMTPELAATCVELAGIKAKEVAEQQEKEREEKERRKAMEEAGELPPDAGDAEAQAAAVLGLMGGGSEDKATPAEDLAPGGDIVDMLKAKQDEPDETAETTPEEQAEPSEQPPAAETAPEAPVTSAYGNEAAQAGSESDEDEPVAPEAGEATTEPPALGGGYSRDIDIASEAAEAAADPESDEPKHTERDETGHPYESDVAKLARGEEPPARDLEQQDPETEPTELGESPGLPTDRDVTDEASTDEPMPPRD